MLKDRESTEFIMTDIQCDQAIPAYIFSKAALQK